MASPEGSGAGLRIFFCGTFGRRDDLHDPERIAVLVLNPFVLRSASPLESALEGRS
jgi:hypothetical protein